MIGFHKGVHDVVQETREDHFFGHPRLHGARRALQDVVGRLETQPEEVDERRLLRHLLELRHVVAVATSEEVADAAPCLARRHLLLDLGDRWKCLGLSALRLLDQRVECVFGEFFEGFGSRFVAHRCNSGRAAQACDERAAIDLKRQPHDDLRSGPYACARVGVNRLVRKI
jgi:hypothetical protein